MNLMDGERTSDGIVVDENWVVPAPADLPQGPVTVGARPENIRLSLTEREGWHPMSVYISEPQGSDTIVNLHQGEKFIRVVTEPDIRPDPNEKVWVNLERSALRLFDATTGQAV